jgi:hypothetical protein
MNHQQAALALLRRLDLPLSKANVLVNEQVNPTEFTVLVFSPERPLDSISSWHGHPVNIIFAGGPPIPQR